MVANFNYATKPLDTISVAKMHKKQLTVGFTHFKLRVIFHHSVQHNLNCPIIPALF